jgi:hypothetical protein
MYRDYLKDTAFLRELDKNNNKFFYVKIIVLDMQEKPISAIEGRVKTGSSINIDGKSAVRRTADLSFVALEEENDLTNVDNLLSINKKISIEVGIQNNFPNNYDDEIFWFPQGIFVIVKPSISHSSTGCIISLNCKDKMCLLNGECGGNLPASITFHEYDQIMGKQFVNSFSDITEPNDRTVYVFPSYITLEGESSQYWQWSKTQGYFISSEEMIGEIVTEPNLIYDIIQTLVCNYGGESINNIIINDVPLEIKQLIRNNSNDNLYYNPATGQYSADQSLSLDITGEWIEFQPGEDCGYVFTDFVYPGDLISRIGENICSVLDKIKDTLGNYEYFYDIEGNFVFQEIKNYLNVSYSPTILGKVAAPLKYTSSLFADSLKNISQLPTNQERIDFIINIINDGYSYQVLRVPIQDVNGERTLIVKKEDVDMEEFQKGYLKLKNSEVFSIINNAQLKVGQYFDTKKHKIPVSKDNNYIITYPLVEGGIGKFLISYYNNNWKLIDNIYIINDENYLVDYNSNKKSIYDFNVENGMTTSFNNSPNYSNIKNDFHIWGKGESNSVIHYHLVIKEKPKIMNTYKVILTEDNQLKIDNDNGIDYTPTDWRVELYLQGKEKESRQQRPDIYEQEIIDLLPTIYEFKQDANQIIGNYKEDVTKVNNLKYFIDYLEPVNDLYDCSVDLIGGRIYSYQQDNIIKLYNNDVPNVIIINRDGNETYNNKIIERCASEGQPYSNVDGNIYSNLSIGTLGYSAQEVARDLLYQYTDYNNTINFQSIPIYYLEPNTRITVNDKKANIYGDYIIQNISRPLDGQGTMSVSATRALERI